jgi:regulatory protein
LKKKLALTNEPNAFKKRDKAARFVIGKGYEPALAWEILKEMTEE